MECEIHVWLKGYDATNVLKITFNLAVFMPDDDTQTTAGIELLLFNNHLNFSPKFASNHVNDFISSM